VRIRHGRGLGPLVAAVAMAVVLLPAWSVSVAQAAGAADAQASAVVELINGERAYHGLAALSPDPYLASKARDGAVWCPNDASKVMDGRAKDMAVNDYFSHALRLCSQYTIIDAMKTWGYTGGRGEIISENSVGVHTVTYTYGCSPSVPTCPGSTITTYNTVARAMSGWMGSSVHYSIITGSYNRVGCGAWVSPGGVYYYACLFALNGSPIVTPRPKATRQPGGAAPGPGVSVEPAAPPMPAPTLAPPWPTPSGASAWVIPPAPAARAGIDPSANDVPEESASGGARHSNDSLPPLGQLALTAFGAAGALALVWLRMGPLGRYGRHRPAP
jgi:uncharacterized protein YkwD